MTSLPVPVSPSMRTVESVGATVRTRSSVFIRAALHQTIPSNSCCFERFSVANLMREKHFTFGKAIFGLPILHVLPFSTCPSTSPISETRLVLELEYQTGFGMRTTPYGRFVGPINGRWRQ